MRDVRIDRATGSDVPALVELNREIQDLHVAWSPQEYKHASAASVAAWFSEWLRKAGAVIFLAREGEVAVGYASCLIRETPENPFRRARRTLLVDHLCVRESHRRRGVGTALFACIEEEARRAEVEGIELDLRSVNEQAKAFYRSRGLSVQMERWVRPLP